MKNKTQHQYKDHQQKQQQLLENMSGGSGDIQHPGTTEMTYSPVLWEYCLWNMGAAGILCFTAITNVTMAVSIDWLLPSKGQC